MNQKAWMVMAVALLLPVGRATAQETPAAKAEAKKPLTVEQMKDQLEVALVAQRKSLAQISVLASEARERKDVLQLNCLKDKLSQSEALLRISEAASASVYKAIAAANQEQVASQFQRVRLASNRAQLVRRDASACVGAQAVFTGNTNITVTKDEVTGENPTQPLPPPVGPPLPPVASGS